MKNLDDDMLGVGRIAAMGNHFMRARVERLTNALLDFDTVLAEQLPQLLPRQLHTSYPDPPRLGTSLLHV